MNQENKNGVFHIIGSGLSGLSAALRLSAKGKNVVLYEAAPHSGGRCRSFYDSKLQVEIDNGNHLLLSCYHETLDLAEMAGARANLVEIKPASFPFFDLRTKRWWNIKPTVGGFPFWLFDSERRAPGGGALDHLAGGISLHRSLEDDIVSEVLDEDSPLFSELWEPLTLGILNTKPSKASASLLAEALSLSLKKGEAYSRPILCPNSLSKDLITPITKALTNEFKVPIHYSRRLKKIDFSGDRASALHFRGHSEELKSNDTLIIATPALDAVRLLPSFAAPSAHCPIVNVHFKLPRSVSLPGNQAFLGLTNGTAQWLNTRGKVLSVTVSAAHELSREPAKKIATSVWQEVERIVGGAPLPDYRVVTEMRATFEQSPEVLQMRPGAKTIWKNVFVAGDWTDTGLPATIEGAVKSGRTVADFFQ